MIDLAVIIVTWNTCDVIMDALDSLYADLERSGLDSAVYVVDSASTDGTPDLIAQGYPQVHLTASQDNLGFAGGNNHAMRQLGFPDDPQARAVYLLNPDTVTQPGATRYLFDALFADAATGLVGARLAYGDGGFQHSAFGFPGLRQLWTEFFPTPGRFIEGRFNGRYPRRLYDGQQPFLVDVVLGATMMLRAEVIQQTGMFDEAFFMYCEEIDWAWRIHKAGWMVRCVPQARVTHLGGYSSAQVRPRSLVNLWTSRLLLYRKHYPGWKRVLARWMVVAGVQRKLRHEQDSALIGAYHTIREMVT